MADATTSPKPTPRFTTGDWRVRPDRSKGEIVGWDIFAGTQAVVGHEGIPPSGMWDAKLIAMAPKLYHAGDQAASMLLEIVEILRESGNWSEDYLKEAEARARAINDALAQARGEAPGASAA